jgi:hypothetical protein
MTPIWRRASVAGRTTAHCDYLYLHQILRAASRKLLLSPFAAAIRGRNSLKPIQQGVRQIQLGNSGTKYNIQMRIYIYAQAIEDGSYLS